MLGRGGGRNDVDQPGLGKILADPMPALGQSLGLRVDPLHLPPLGPAEQAVMNPEPNLGPNLQAGESHEHVERVGDPAVGRVLQRHDPELHVPAIHFLEHGGDRADRDMLDRFAKLGHSGEIAIAVLGSQTGDAHGPLKRAGAAHQLAEDEPKGFVGKGAAAVARGVGDHFVLAGRRPDFQALLLLQLADLQRDLSRDG